MKHILYCFALIFASETVVKDDINIKENLPQSVDIDYEFSNDNTLSDLHEIILNLDNTNIDDINPNVFFNDKTSSSEVEALERSEKTKTFNLFDKESNQTILLPTSLDINDITMTLEEKKEMDKYLNLGEDIQKSKLYQNTDREILNKTFLKEESHFVTTVEPSASGIETILQEERKISVEKPSTNQEIDFDISIDNIEPTLLQTSLDINDIMLTDEEKKELYKYLNLEDDRLTENSSETLSIEETSSFCAEQSNVPSHSEASISPSHINQINSPSLTEERKEPTSPDNSLIADKTIQNPVLQRKRKNTVENFKENQQSAIKKSKKKAKIDSNSFDALILACPSIVSCKTVSIRRNAFIIENIITILKNIYSVCLFEDLNYSYLTMLKDTNIVEKTINTIINNIKKEKIKSVQAISISIPQKDMQDIVGLMIGRTSDILETFTKITRYAFVLSKNNSTKVLIQTLLSEVKNFQSEIQELNSMILTIFLKYSPNEECKNLKVFISRLAIILHITNYLQSKSCSKVAILKKIFLIVFRAFVKYSYCEWNIESDRILEEYFNVKKVIKQEQNKNPQIETPVNPDGLLVFEVLGYKMKQICDFFVKPLHKLCQTAEHTREFEELEYFNLVKSLQQIYEIGDFLTDKNIK
ncbi:hypothetical protein NGRA_1052 [Nosema granulosis]|uniref:Uncharacterized protein n=1 Tax=Nosema granulosis TaxID=83296 RepID=A0A9P6H1X2_9MICR|nr:hypothetical protein NGRA_1052 [Nosema granulosis]